ncbi:hypothetical protein V5E97_32180 [Singulisphaera sp. Ch08]|uniref:Secreted protein n=1 Tax=Singulisphaera sp. Ch08 TaxID=3120278 RepID=A0AAU7CBY3_9BACT
MKSRTFHFPVVLFLIAGLFAQVGLLRVSRSAFAPLGSFPAPVSSDADPVDDTPPEEEDDRGEETTRDELNFGGSSSPSFRRGLIGPLSFPRGATLPAMHVSRLVPCAGHFLAVGRELRYWIQSPLC